MNNSFDKKRIVKSTPKRSKEFVKKTTFEPERFSDKYPVYWVRVLELLQVRKSMEMDIKNNPEKYGTRDYDVSDYHYDGFRQDDLNTELSKRVKNSSLRSIDYRDLLEIMCDPTRSYVNRYEDSKGATRYRITALGEMALKRMADDEIMKGFWDIIAKTEKPKREPASLETLKKLRR